MADDLRKQDSGAALNPNGNFPVDNPGDGDALHALAVEWARWAFRTPTVPTGAMKECGPQPDLQAEHPADLPFRVRIVECVNGSASAARTVASFEDQTAAESFIRSKVADGKSFGSNAGRNWGVNVDGDQVCYWIETDQETAPIKRPVKRASRSR